MILTNRNVNISTMSSSKRRSLPRSYLGKNTDERMALRRDKFLDAGKVAFGNLGFQSTKISDVCAAAGLTERYYYEAFGSLTKLFEAVYLRELEVLRQALDKAAAQAPDNPEAKAQALIEAYFRLLEDDRRLARILIIDIYGAAPSIDHLYSRGVQQFADRFGLAVVLGLKDSLDPRLDAGLISTALVGAASSLAMRWYVGGYREPRAAIVQSCLAIFLAVIRMGEKMLKDSSTLHGKNRNNSRR